MSFRARLLDGVLVLVVAAGASRALSADLDADGVDDAIDNCLGVNNPSVPANWAMATPWMTLTGTQRDDDADGRGNACDIDFNKPSSGCGPGMCGFDGLILSDDILEFKMSMGENRTADTCGVSNMAPCAIFDLDSAGTQINTADLLRLNQLNVFPFVIQAVSPSCTDATACALTCSAGVSGSCGCPWCGK